MTHYIEQLDPERCPSLEDGDSFIELVASCLTKERHCPAPAAFVLSLNLLVRFFARGARK